MYHPLSLLFLLISLLATLATSTLLWDGRANSRTSPAFLSHWSWSNPVGPYQYYIHGPQPVRHYIGLAPRFANPADKGSKRGFRVTLDGTAHWEGQSMLRTELIPQTSAAISQGMVYYHFSLQHTRAHAPTTAQEHQIAFFESHFTELKFGGSAGNKLQWLAGGSAKWSTPFKPGVWHNMAYGIDFAAGTVTLFHSTGGGKLVKVAGPVAVDAQSNGQDWHVGVLKLPSGGAGDDKREDWHFSGVYIEKGGLTKGVSGP